MSGTEKPGADRTRVAVALLAGRRVLLIHRQKEDDEYWVVPGGGVEPGETIEDAARREIREETSLELKSELSPLIDIESFDERHGVKQRYVAFTADAPGTEVHLNTKSPEAAKASDSDRYDFEWVELGAIATLNVQPTEVKTALEARSDGEARAASLDWFTVERIDETTFALTEDGHWEHVNCYLFVGSDRAALVDTGTGIADIRTVVCTLVDLPIVVLTTHVHWDHIGGHGLFDERLVHRLDADWLRNGIPQPLDSQRANLMLHPFAKAAPPDFSVERWKPHRGEATELLEDGDVIELGGRRLSVVHTPGHSPGHVAFHEPEREYLVTGDVLYRGTLDAFYESTDPVAFARSIDKLCELDRVATILPGHNEFSLDRDDLVLAQASFQAIERKGALHHGSGLHEFGPISIRL